jgi:hypothetical protein
MGPATPLPDARMLHRLASIEEEAAPNPAARGSQRQETPPSPPRAPARRGSPGNTVRARRRFAPRRRARARARQSPSWCRGRRRPRSQGRARRRSGCNTARREPHAAREAHETASNRARRTAELRWSARRRRAPAARSQDSRAQDRSATRRLAEQPQQRDRAAPRSTARGVDPVCLGPIAPNGS